MKINSNELKNIVDLAKISFEERFLRHSCYRENRSKISKLFRNKRCTELEKAFNKRLTKRLLHNGII